MTRLLPLVLLLVYPTLASAQAWTLSGSPYRISGRRVISGATFVTIEAGVELIFEEGAYLDVQGILNVEGTGRQPVVFRAETPLTEWNGIQTQPGSTLIVRHAEFHHLREGLTVRSGARVEDSLFAAPHEGGNALRCIAGHARLSRVQVLNADITVETDCQIEVGNAAFEASSILLNGDHTGRSLWRFDHITLNASPRGIRLNTSVPDATVEIRNSIIANSHGVGTAVVDTGGFLIRNSIVWNNDSGIVGDTDASVVEVDPGFISDRNLRLRGDSPAIDSAVGNEFLFDAAGHPRPVDGDADGTGVPDIGAYEVQSACGDGFVEGSERCDDGESNGTYGFCGSDCSQPSAFCGDGVTNGDEGCDDGPRNGAYGACASDCTGPGRRCGDGHRDPNELCDDGNTDNDDECLATCTEARCGDGWLQPAREQCDDGNLLNGDFCTNDCRIATCGDGILLDGVEQCDDGNRNPGDGCNPLCELEDASSDAGTRDAGPEDAGPGEAHCPANAGGCSVSHESPPALGFLVLTALLLRRRRQR